MNTGVLLKAAINGRRARGDHPALPVSLEECAADARACVGAGAGAIHLHPRNDDGLETLEPQVVDAFALAVRDACGVPVGVSTGAWIEADPERRATLVGAWGGPDFASVNLFEDGWLEVMEACASAGIGIEAGVFSVADAEALAASPFAQTGRLLRVLVELEGMPAAEAPAVTDAIHDVLDRAGITAPRVQHGMEELAWPVLRDAITRGLGTRIGLEDTLVGPDGEDVAGNVSLVGAARALGAG